ncbi:MAG: hypothetical protein Q7U91_03080 [Sideroxyarcus sp.]|nr:hypothetical protein [Sideroxyarcus sp.]
MAEISVSMNTRTGSVHNATIETRYTKSIDESGWLMILLDGKSKVSVPEFVKVVLMKKRGKNGEPTKENETRTYFIVQEGRYKGETASLSKENSEKCLIKTTRGKGANITAKIIGRSWEFSQPKKEKYNQLWATLSFDGKQARITLDSDVPFIETNTNSPYRDQILHSKPLPKGTYKIRAPEAAGREDFTNFYVTGPGGYSGLKYHTVWFLIENATTHNSNFVHVGNVSEGCVTMYQLEMWNVLYRYLISNRMDKEGKYVGTVTIE